ncbi:MAG: hypothetical protein V1944_02760 [Candidatus Aenigmatarchaeota archaeon]
MPIEDQIGMCSQNYQKWKDMALTSRDQVQSRKFTERAFFWLELQTAFISLWAIEQAKGKDPIVKKKIQVAKKNLSNKLAQYIDQTMKELEL